MIDIDTKLLKPIAAKFNLSLTSFDEVITDPSVPSYGSVVLSNPWGTQLEPAPISPYKGSAAFDIFSSTIKSVYTVHRGLEGDDNIKVYPTYMTGNTGTTDYHSDLLVGSHTSTDTGYYWKLSENIYRYSHRNDIKKGPGGIHTVNESRLISPCLDSVGQLKAIVDLSADNWLEMIKFFTTLILNADEAANL